MANKIGPEDKVLDSAIDQLQNFVENYRELERLLGAEMKYNYPPEARLSDRVNVIGLAEDIAINERNRLGCR